MAEGTIFVTFSALTTTPDGSVGITVDSSGVDNGGDCFELSVSTDNGSIGSPTLEMGDETNACDNVQFNDYIAPSEEGSATVTVGGAPAGVDIVYNNGPGITIVYTHVTCNVTISVSTLAQGRTATAQFSVNDDFGGISWESVHASISGGDVFFDNNFFNISDETGGFNIINSNIASTDLLAEGTHAYAAEASPSSGTVLDFVFNPTSITITKHPKKMGAFMAM